jgi:hypothetical protein
MSQEKVMEKLNDFSVTLEFTVGQLNEIVNTINQAGQAPATALVGIINAIQLQAGPQVEKARADLESVLNADSVPKDSEEKN